MDEASLRRCIGHYTAELLPVAHGLCSGPIEAEDLLQELWMRAMIKAPSGDPSPQLRSWLYSTLLNLGRSRLRKHKRRATLRMIHLAVEPASETQPSLVGEFERRALWRAIARLPELQRNVLLLRILEDHSVAETAAVLGRAPGTIKASLHRALRRLRRDLKEADER